MNRRFEVLVDSPSWSPALVPPELLARVGTRQVDVLTALLFTAISTRPPTTYGFHLSDLWAWLRYIPAVAATDELRLREEWTDVDRHQKTILSDEFGVGFATQFITEVFGCAEFVDTLYAVRVLEPEKFTLSGELRAGSQKSPDYIARQQNSGYVVLECKGTQSSRAALKRAIARGQEQKANLGAVSPARINHSLVAGLFIPQWNSAEPPCLLVSDPSWEALERFLSGQPNWRIDLAITQVALAKQLTLAGLRSIPEHLVSSRAGDIAEPSTRSELRNLYTEDYRVVFDSSDLRSRIPAAEMLTRVVFSVRTSSVILNGLNYGKSLAEMVSELSKKDPRSWEVATTNSVAEVTTPLGFSFRLEVEPHNTGLKRTDTAPSRGPAA